MARSQRTLAEQLGAPLPPGIEALAEEHKEIIGDALRQARRKQATALSAAAEESLSHVPFLLRGAVRKAAGL
ncbi:hypothetical protein [Prauserella flavalba]|uniref:Uncharacterized protein n=1 Tax=Prauserella flavalba TaxID=1477506 RepID=A0A318LCS2_9PSEU|nr:hypothetical protein [Prauserella flavalba]PXY18236.1 hypothetical protein BA062_35900 [Prauserella flavalba]